MRSPEFPDPEPSVETEYDDDDGDPGPLDEEEEEPTSFEDEHPEHPEPGPEEEDDGGEVEGDAADQESAPFDDEESEGQALAVAEIEARAPRWARLGDLLLDYKHWRNPRTLTGLDPVSLQALADDIRKKSVPTGATIMAGVEEALWVVRIQGTKNKVDELVIDGQRRMRAMEMTDLGPDALVPVRDMEPEPVAWSKDLAQRYLRAVHKNVALREGLSAFELSESAEDLRASNDPDTGNVTTIGKIAEILGRSESWVSKILTARKGASPNLLERWRKGEISEEQFRDLATGTRGQEQDQEAEKIAAARAGGDKAGARQSAKEKKEIARREAQAKRDKAKADKEAAKAKKRADREAARASKKQGKGKRGAVVSGPQADLPLAAAEPEKPAPAPPPPKPLQRVIVDDVITMVERKPPTHDLVKGVILGILVATGRKDMSELPKQWHQYVQHASGTAPAKTSGKSKKKRGAK